jgi:OOP family OmpA-OmpF porin
MKKVLTTAALVVAAFAAAPASAQFYGGLSLGRSDLNGNAADINNPGLTITGTGGDKKSAWKVFGGYQFTPNWGAELAYASLGSATGNLSRTVPAGTGTFRVKNDNWALFGTGTLPIASGFNLTGKVGLSMNRARMTFSGSGAGFFASDSGGDRNTALALGIGANYWFNRNLAVRAEWEDFGKVGTPTNGLTTAGRPGTFRPRLFSVGLQYGF